MLVLTGIQRYVLLTHEHLFDVYHTGFIRGKLLLTY